jgi:phosphate transport system permease protein
MTQMDVDLLTAAPRSISRASSAQPARTRTMRRADRAYQAISLGVACVALGAVLVAVVLTLFSTAWPAISRLGFGFLTGTTWNSATDVYGALPFIVGTLLTTFLALLIAVPVSVAIAILLTEYAPAAVAAVIGVVVDVAAGVPTIVFGAWALIALVPWLRDVGDPKIQSVLGWLPPFSTPSIGYLTGQGMLTTGLVLSAMVFPTIVSVTRNSFIATPVALREASLGIGATRWETATRVVLRAARPGVVGAVVLACGRALGETMAVVYVIGSTAQIPTSLFDIGHTLSAELLLEGGNTIPGTLKTAALYELGLILLLFSLVTSFLGRALTNRFAGGPSRAGAA